MITAPKGYIWNRRGDVCIKLATIKEFTVGISASNSSKFCVLAWVGKEEAHKIGEEFDSKDAAQQFICKIFEEKENNKK